MLGLTSSGLAWALLSIEGVATLFTRYPILAMALRWLGAAYLVWYGAKLLRTTWRGRVQSAVLPGQDMLTHGAAFRLGWLTGMTNPKGAVFWTSAFAASFPADAPLWFYGVTLLLVAAMSLSWHLGITQVFAIAALRSGYLRLERAINALSGSALVLLGMQRALSR